MNFALWIASAVVVLSFTSCVNIDLTRREAEFEPAATATREPDSLGPEGVIPSSAPAPNRAPDPTCYLYSGEVCVAPVIETTTLAPEFMIPPPEPVPVTE